MQWLQVIFALAVLVFRDSAVKFLFLKDSNFFPFFFLSLTTSSWQTHTVINSESVTSAMRWRSPRMRLSIANTAHQNLLRQKLSTRPRCQRQLISGIFIHYLNCVSIFLPNTSGWCLSCLSLGQLELLHTCGELCDLQDLKNDPDPKSKCDCY